MQYSLPFYLTLYLFRCLWYGKANHNNTFMSIVRMMVVVHFMIFDQHSSWLVVGLSFYKKGEFS